MAMVKKSITLTEQQDAWIKAQIVSGDFGNDSEVVRNLIRKEQNQNTDIEAIRAALIEAEGRDFSTRTADEIKQAVQQRLRNNGRL